ncbi:hypothetical protein OHA62_46845 [Streptomyces sp. NBC_00343]|nr:RHS repeat-associated core domain-containing protein [Streptomyces sp. NBC_00343]
MCDDLLGIVFPHLEKVLVEHVWVEGGMVRVRARTLDGAFPCPSCGLCSYRVHSRYRRHLADAAVGGCPVVVDLSVRRLFCDVTDCARRTFAEQADGTDRTRVLYLFGGAEQITLNVSAKTWTGLRNITGPDGTTVTRFSTGSVTYQVANGQGTAVTAVDASTLAVTRRSFDPFGNPRGTKPSSWVASDENQGFLGQPTDPGTGLGLLGARNYDPVTGRFLSPDPVFECGDPNQLGGYTYAGDDPVSGSDPSGLMLVNDGGGGGGCDAKCAAANDKAYASTTSSNGTKTHSSGCCSGFWGCAGHNSRSRLRGILRGRVGSLQRRRKPTVGVDEFLANLAEKGDQGLLVAYVDDRERGGYLFPSTSIRNRSKWSRAWGLAPSPKTTPTLDPSSTESMTHLNWLPR